MRVSAHSMIDEKEGSTLNSQKTSEKRAVYLA
jgi:hypothetical protein